VSGKYLIVNADDYATDQDRNRGILEAAERGIVTSTTIIANRLGAGDSLSRLEKVFAGRTGIHLNLTFGVPLGGNALTLTDEFGRFLNKTTVWQKAFRRTLDLAEVEREFTAQINHLLMFGIRPDHIDGNNHIHVFPDIAKVVARLANHFAITWVRLPQEPFTCWRQYVQPGTFKKSFIGLLSHKAAPVFREHGLRFTDSFSGIQFPKISRVESLRAFVANLPTGTTELMCHPGYSGDGSNPFSSAAREAELKALTHPAVFEEVAQRDIRLISYREANA
jgi:chitin disaccharide deacetylase